MIRSMTAFARQSAQYEWGSAVWEIRTVNHRYLEPSFKLPETMRPLEPQLRELIRKQLARGKVECALKLQHFSQKNTVEFNPEIAKQVISAAESIRGAMNKPGQTDPLSILAWPGVLVESELNAAEINEQVLAQFSQAIEQLAASRTREGEVLKQFTEQRLDSIAHITQAIRDQLPTIMTAQKERLEQKLAEFTAELEPGRLEQEVVILLNKADIAEELDRLDTHVQEVTRVLKKGGGCGRRLDFLMQELNREANTLSSKSLVTDTTQAAVELKVLIEQMREQIQNIE